MPESEKDHLHIRKEIQKEKPTETSWDLLLKKSLTFGKTNYSVPNIPFFHHGIEGQPRLTK
jgi:hypothetical protein